MTVAPNLAGCLRMGIIRATDAEHCTGDHYRAQNNRSCEALAHALSPDEVRTYAAMMRDDGQPCP